MDQVSPLVKGGFRRGLFSALGSALGVAAFAGALAANASSDVFVPATYTTIEGNLKSVNVPGVVLPSGWVWFNTTVTSGPLTYTWNYNVNPSAASNAVFNGATTVKNNAAFAVAISTTIEFDLCPGVIADSKFGGTANVKLVTNSNGGQLVCATSQHLTGVLVNGREQFVHYWCPFLMTSSGAGTAQTSTAFGQPFPSAPGPANVESYGHFANFVLTDGDTAIFTAYALAGGEAPFMPAPECPMDVNGDGVVNKWDLVALLDSFGDTGSCLACDFNGDGIVNGIDLAMLLQSWGACPN